MNAARKIKFSRFQKRVLAAVLGFSLAVLPAFVQGMCASREDRNHGAGEALTTSDHHHAEHGDDHHADAASDTEKTCCSDRFKVDAALNQNPTKRTPLSSFAYDVIFMGTTTVLVATVSFADDTRSGAPPPDFPSPPLYTRYVTFLI